MRESIFLSGLLTNTEAWINILKEDLDTLEEPDTMKIILFVLSKQGASADIVCIWPVLWADTVGIGLSKRPWADSVGLGQPTWV